MASRGVKPKPASLRLVEGTHRPTRHGPEENARESVESSAERFGKPVCPKRLQGEGLAAWGRYIEPAWWLDVSREPAAIAFCELWQNFLHAPTAFAAAKHGQLRAYMSELGLTDERNRGVEDEKVEDEFFD